MQDVFREAVNLLGRGDQVVVATVVRTKGSTPQKPGAKLLVRKDGSGVGTLGGGCVEGDIWFAAKQLMRRGGSAEHREYQLNEDLAAQDGLVCGGTMYFLIDPVYQPDSYLSYAKEIDAAYRGEGSVAMASLIEPGNASETPLGAKLFIRENGTTEGSLGDPDLDREAVGKAKELMIHGRTEYVVADAGAEYFIEAYTSPPQLVICGGGHVSKAIAPLAKPLGFRLFITDDREEFANAERFPEAEMVVALTPEKALAELPINPNTFIVIATRGHKYDHVALEAAAATPAKYVGLMGSRRKTILIYEELARSGLPVERIKEIRSPIGLDIRARTPEEIAVSIMSEILMFRLGGTGGPMTLEEHRIDRIVEKVQAERSVAVAD
ncbi:MAG: XdhC family protein [Chloroflexi bacterium]|nr:XdhC family protein [Chloroflexota bacterium]